MNQMTDYEYEAMQKKEAEQAAIKAEQKREFKGWLIGIVLWLVATVLLMCAGHWYYRWLHRPFTPPPELLTGAEFRELVDGYPLLAEALDGIYSEDMNTVMRGEINHYADLDSDGEWDVRVWFPLYGKFESSNGELREEEPYELGGLAYRYSIFDLGKGKPHTPWEEHIFGEDHTAHLSITVRNPSPDHGEYREAVEDMLRIVRGE